MFRLIKSPKHDETFPRIHISVGLDFGGSETQMLNLAREYLRKGSWERVEFYSLTKGGITTQAMRGLGIRVVVIGENPTIPNLRLIWVLATRIRKVRPRVVVTNGAEANFHGVIAARLAGVRYVIAEEIGIGNHSILARIIFRLTNVLTTANIAASPQVAEHMLAGHEVSKSKLSVIYAPMFIGDDQVKGRTLDFSNWKFVYLGRLEPVKNLDLLLDAFQILKREYEISNWSLLLVGEGSEKERLLEKVQSLDLKQEVTFHGRSDDAKKLLTQSHFLVQSSLSEGMGLSLAEALHVGTPVITTNVGIASEVVTNSKNGFLVESHQAKDFAQALLSATHMTVSEFHEMSSSALHTELTRYSTESYLNNIEVILRK